MLDPGDQSYSCWITSQDIDKKLNQSGDLNKMIALFMFRNSQHNIFSIKIKELKKIDF